MFGSPIGITPQLMKMLQQSAIVKKIIHWNRRICFSCTSLTYKPRENQGPTYKYNGISATGTHIYYKYLTIMTSSEALRIPKFTLKLVPEFSSKILSLATVN